MEKDWVKIYSSSNMQHIELLKALLDENEIESVIINKQDSSYPVFGEMELYVNHTKAFNANQLIKTNEFE